MAQRHGQRVGHVGRVGDLGQGQFALNCPLHLRFRRPARAGKDLFYLRGRVMHNRNARPAAARQMTPRAWPISIAVLGRL